MITVIKETPITVNGHDCIEQLVHNDDLNDCTACDVCLYREWDDYLETLTDCNTVHDCTRDANTYYRLK